MAAMSGVSLVNTIQSEIEKAQLDLKGVDENLRKLTGRDFGDSNQRPEQRRGRLLSGGRDDEPPAKRRPQGVFARLGGVVLEQHYNESRGRGRGGFRRNSDGVEPRGERVDGRGDLRAEIQGGGGESRGGRRVQEVVEDDEKMPKPSLASSVARPQVDFKSRTEAAAELTKDRASRDRNRRMFGALLGTLKRFKNEEIKQKDKEEQRAAIDRKLEEKGRAEKEELRRERLELFNQRKERQAQIRRLTLKMARVKEHEAWESHMMKLTKFIRTKSSPRIFWLPQTHNSKTTSLVRATHDIISRELEENRQRLKEELDEILGSRADDDQGEEGRDAAEGGEEEEEESDSFMRRGVRSEIARQGEGGAMNTLDNCADLLDYEAEEGELVYDEADLSGKDNNDTERVVVQVDGRGIGGRKVEIVGGQALDRTEGLSKLGGGNDSEKENQGRLKDKDKSRDKDKNADRDRRHRDKGRDKDRGRDRDKGKDGERERGSDRRSGRDKDKKKEKARDKSKDSEKEKSKSKSAEVEEPMSPDLEATIVHIKIEKDDEDFVKEHEPMLKAVKEEKLEKSSGNTEKDEEDRNISVNDTLPDGELPPSPTIAVPLPTDSPSPPRDSVLDASSSPTATGASVSSVIPASSPKHSPPFHLPSSPSIPSSPVPQQPNQPTPAAASLPLPVASMSGKDSSATDPPADKKEEQMEVEECKNYDLILSTSLDIKPGDIQLPEGNPVQQVSSADNRKSSKSKLTKEDKKVSDKSEKSKKKLDDQKKSDHKKSDEQKKTDEKKGSKKVESGSSDDSSSDDSSSDSSSDSSESDSTDSESSSSSSGSSSGTSSDSESDSSSSSSSDSHSGGEKKKKRMKRGGKKKDESRSEDSSSDSEKEGKSKKKGKYDQGKLKDTKKNDSKPKIKEEPPSDDDKNKKNSSSKDKKRDGEKIKEKEPGYKSRDKEKERDSARKQEREKGKMAGRSKSRERKRDRSRSRERRRERSRSRDKNRRDRKDRR